MRIGPIGAEKPFVRTDNGDFLDLSELTHDIDGGFLEDDGLSRVARAIERGDLTAVDVTGLRIGAPIARPGAVLCIGMNYAAHAAESNSSLPAWPVMFYKAPNTVVGPDDDVLLPPGAQKVDWEVELALVISQRARYLDSPADARRHIAGFSISNDVSERALQLETSGGQWSKGKSCETFNPLGPWLVTLDEITDPQSLRLQSRVNGVERQDSNTQDMIFTVERLVWELSQVTVLEPGDLINTGTPEGVALSGRFPYLAEGDTVELEITGLGRQRQHVRRGGR